MQFHSAGLCNSFEFIFWKYLLSASDTEHYSGSSPWDSLPYHLPFPCCIYDITPSLYVSTLLSVGHWCSTCGQRPQPTSKSPGKLVEEQRLLGTQALTNPRMRGVGARGLHVSQKPQMVIHFIVWNPLPRHFLKFAALSHPRLQKKLVRYDSTATKNSSWNKGLFRTLALSTPAVRLWSVVKLIWDKVCTGPGRMLGLKWVFNKWLLLLVLSLSINLPQTDYASLPTSLQLPCLSGFPHFFCWPDHFTSFPGFSLLSFSTDQHAVLLFMLACPTSQSQSPSSFHILLQLTNYFVKSWLSQLKGTFKVYILIDWYHL